MAKILLIEDEDSLAVGLVDVLRLKGYSVERESEGDLALKRALQESFDLIVLDAELPALNGFEILKELRGRGSEVRVLMLTARTEETDRVLGFELGVDDYVTKPFSLLELLGRIKAILRRTANALQNESPQSLRLHQTIVDFERFRVEVAGREVPLPAKGFEILRILWQKRGRAVSRDELMDAAWGVDDAVTPRTLNNLIVKLRQTIEPNPEDPQFLKTVHGVGYRLELDETKA